MNYWLTLLGSETCVEWPHAHAICSVKALDARYHRPIKLPAPQAHRNIEHKTLELVNVFATILILSSFATYQYTNFVQKHPPQLCSKWVLFTIICSKHTQFVSTGCLCLWWKPPNHYTTSCKKVPQEAGIYTYTPCQWEKAPPRVVHSIEDMVKVCFVFLMILISVCSDERLASICLQHIWMCACVLQCTLFMCQFYSRCRRHLTDFTGSVQFFRNLPH